MKWINIYLTGIIALTSATVQANPKNIEKKLASVDVFSIGFNGFIAKKCLNNLFTKKPLRTKILFRYLKKYSKALIQRLKARRMQPAVFGKTTY